MITVPEYIHNFIMLTQTANNQVEPKSGLYLDVLEGISTKNVAEFTTEKYNSARNLVEDKSRFAASSILNEIWNELDNKISYNEWQPKSNYFTRTKITTGTTSVELQKSVSHQFAKFYIESVSFKVCDNNEITIYIKNKQGEILQTLTATADNDEMVTISVNALFDEKHLIFECDFTGRVTYKTDLQYQNTCCGYVAQKPKIRIYGNNNGTKDLYHAKGLIVNYSLQCDATSYKEQAAMMLKQAILYKCGAEVLKELVSSTRLNIITLHSKEWATAKIAEWEQLAVDFAHDEIDNIFKSLQLKDKFCIRQKSVFGSW